jgi:hypothetical protein
MSASSSSQDQAQARDRAEWVRQLHEPWTRRAARQKLVAARAVEPLIECLGSTNESVVWAAVTSLGEMRAREAIGPLVGMLEQGRLTLDVSEALKLITGQDFGADLAAWRRWMDDSGAVAAPSLDVEQCVRQTAAYLGVEPSGSGDSYRFKLSLADGREQKVAVFFGRKDDQDDELVVIYSECGPAKPKYYEAVLRKNLTIPAGAFGLRDVDGQPNFVMVDTMLAAIVTPSLLAKRIENIAARADMVEKVLAKEDRR